MNEDRNTRLSTLHKLLRAKAHSDRKEYGAKTAILNKLIDERPDEFEVDSDADGIVGLTHTPTNFRIHMKSDDCALLKDAAMNKIVDAKGIPAAIRSKTGDLTKRLSLDVAASKSAAATGYMGRFVVRDDEGLLFVKAGSFWMKNVHTDLDLAFLDADGVVTEVQTMRKIAGIPDWMYPSHAPTVPGAVSALELAGGWCARHGIGPGDKLVIGVE